GGVDRGLAAIDRLDGEVGAAEPESGKAEPRDDRIGAEFLDHEPQQRRGDDAEPDREREAGNDRVPLHDAEHGGAATNDHQSLETEVPDAGARGENAGHGDVDERRAVAKGGDDELVHHPPPAVARRLTRRSSPGQVRAVMNSAMAALMMS